LLKNKGRYTILKITDTRVRLVNNEDSKLKAIASITIEECFVVHDIRVLEGQQGYFVRMPNRKTPDGQYKDVAHPINTETREYVNKVVLEAFEAEKAKPAQE
jgi:stage V sporulation protein G